MAFDIKALLGMIEDLENIGYDGYVGDILGDVMIADSPEEISNPLSRELAMKYSSPDEPPKNIKYNPQINQEWRNDVMFDNRNPEELSLDELKTYMVLNHWGVTSNKEIDEFVKGKKEEYLSLHDKAFKSKKDEDWNKVSEFQKNNNYDYDVIMMFDDNNGAFERVGSRFMDKYGVRDYEEQRVFRIELQKQVAEDKYKQEYFNYLDSPNYREVAKRMWGDKATENIDKQKEIIQNIPIKAWKDMDIKTQLRLFYDPSGDSAFYNPIKGDNYIGVPRSEGYQHLPHELSHSVDSQDLPSDIRIAQDGSGGFNLGRVNSKYSYDEIVEMKKLRPEYGKWNERLGNNMEYFKQPTEVRARVNELRIQMDKDEFNYIQSDENKLMDYLKNLKHNRTIDAVKELQEDGHRLNNRDLLDLLQNFALNNNKEETFNV